MVVMTISERSDGLHRLQLAALASWWRPSEVGLRRKGDRAGLDPHFRIEGGARHRGGVIWCSLEVRTGDSDTLQGMALACVYPS